MALITCPECGHTVSDKATQCPQCGYPIAANNETTNTTGTTLAEAHSTGTTTPTETTESEAPQKPKTLKYTLIALFAIVIIALLGLATFNASTSSTTDETAADTIATPTNSEEAMAYLKEQHPDIQTTLSGLGYRHITEGEGDTPNDNEEVIISYIMTNLNGKVIDQDDNLKAHPVDLMLGMREAVGMMSAGGNSIFYIPTELAYNDTQNPDIPAGFLIADITLKEIISKDFIQGGHSYTGIEIRDNAGLERNEHAETTYTINCYNDGTMTWQEISDYHGQREHKYQGNWKKNSGSKFDNSYVWYEFWGTTYDIHMNEHYQMIGFADEQGQLYTMFSVEDPVMAIYNNQSVCQLKAK